MKKYFGIFCMLLFMSTFMGLKSEVNKRDTIFYDEFYLILNDLIRMRLTGASVIKCETMPVYKIWTRNNLGKKSIFNVNSCIAQIKKKNLDSVDAKYMYNSIDSTRVFNIDPGKVILPVITEIKFEEIFRNDDFLKESCNTKEGYDRLEKNYGSRCFISASTPIFNSSYTKAILFINYCCDPKNKGINSCGYEFILEKEKGRWRLINENLTWITGIGY